METIGKNVATKGTNYAKNVDNAGYNLFVADSSDEWFFGNSYFWLRSPGGAQTDAAHVLSGGYLYMRGYYVDRHDIGVRPALWISD